MNVSNWLNRHQTAVVIVVLIALVCGIALIYRSKAVSGRRSSVYQAYFLDLQSGKLFAAASNEPAPIAAPSGGKGVRAYVFACGKGACGDESKHFTAYLERYSDDALRELQKPKDQRKNEIVMSGMLLAPTDQPDQWVPANGAKGRRLQDTPVERCRDVVECRP